MRAGIAVLILTAPLVLFPFQAVMAADTTAPNVPVEANSIPNNYLDTEAPDGVGSGSGTAESVAGVTSSDDSTATTDNTGMGGEDSDIEKAKAAAEAAKNDAEKVFEKAMTDKPDNGANNPAASGMNDGGADSSVDQDLEMFKRDAEKGAEQAVTDSSDTGVDDTATADDDY